MKQFSRILKSTFFACLLAMLLGCGANKSKSETDNLSNIVWLVTEDQSPEFFPMYGDSTVSLPNLEGLAKDGVVFNNAYAPVPVCAPTRSGIITGMYPTTLGTQNMRTYNAYNTENQPQIGIPSYSPIVPENTRMFTEYLRQKGYYCSNNDKEDYNFKTLESAWDDSSKNASWRNRPKDVPFFAVFNFGRSHESGIWKYADDKLLISPDSVPVPPVFPDDPVIRKDLAVNYSNLKHMDDAIGKMIKQLKEDGLYDNTIIFFYGDHGGPFPRYKRALYETGTKVPLIIKFQGNKKKSDSNNDLVNFIDFAPTLLSWAGIKPPEHIQGKALFGKYRDTTQRKYLFTTSDRFDGFTDRLRAVRSKRYKYIKNFNTGQTNALPVVYREQMPIMQRLNEMNKAGTLDSVQSLWFRVPKPEEELYDLEHDPYELNNLANRPELQNTLALMRTLVTNWIADTDDKGRFPEKELIQKWLPKGHQPQLLPLETEVEENKVMLRSNLPDATIIWKEPNDTAWKIYTKPIPADLFFRAKAVRIGFKNSTVFEHQQD